MPFAILCVDDNEIALRTRKLVLESAGHHVQTAVNAAGARELIASRPFDLAIVDYHLEGIRGDELAASLKATRPGLSVILLSGEDGLGNLEHVESFVHKCDGPQALLKEVERLMKKD